MIITSFESLFFECDSGQLISQYHMGKYKLLRIKLRVHKA